ncbi:MAG: hypothetical protein JWM68_1590 [Verrucomicrobiales bacterium]|nr:hypothetical protein [Verrucomicrobiales bacterium]
MDFFSIVLFLVLYYIRPYEWLSWVAVLKPIMICMALAIFAMFNRERGFVFRDIFRTPHDWMMMSFFVWIVISAGNPFDALGRCYNLFVFYIVIVQALSNLERIQSFLNWWLTMLLLVAFMALASEYGFDPTGAYDVTHGIMKNRLVLNTSLFNNPNALGHTVVPCLMMLYYVWYWKRPIFSKIATIPLVAMVLYCIYLTVSKGSFLSAFASLVVTYSFGRPKAVQIAILVLAITVGYGALYALPRMDDLKKAQSDPGIQGRLAAWQFGMEMLQTRATGVGLGQFIPAFTKTHTYEKASHGSYVQVGTETGAIGLFFYLGILYCNARTLITAKTKSIEEERIRRILFAFLCGYFVSSWMVDMGFRATYFFIAAATAAFHRRMLLNNQTELPKSNEVEVRPFSGGFSRQLPIGVEERYLAAPIKKPLAPAPVIFSFTAESTKEKEKVADVPGITWNRIGVRDLISMGILLFLAVQLWRYLMYHI